MLKKIKSHYLGLSLPVKSAVWFMGCELLLKGISFLTVPVFTRIMSVSQYGLYSTYLSVSGILCIFLTMQFESCAYVNMIGKAGSEEEKDRGAISLLSLSFCITTAGFLLYFISHRKISGILSLPEDMMLLMFLEIYGQPVFQFWVYRKRFQYSYQILVAVTILKTVLSVCGGVLAVWLAPEARQASARVLVLAAVQLGFGIALYAVARRRAGRLFLCRGWIKSIRLQLPMIPYSLSMTLLLSADRIMINSMVGSAEAGIYSIAYSAGQLMIILKSCIVDSIKPWIYEKLECGDAGAVGRSGESLMLLFLLLPAVFSLLAPEFVGLLAPGEYREAVYVIPPIAASAYFTLLSQFFVVIETYYEKTKNMMSAALSACGINLVLNRMLIPRFGYLAAGYTTLASYMLLALFQYFQLRKLEKNQLGQRLFSPAKMTACGVGAAVSGCMCLALYPFPSVRYAATGILAAVCMLLFLRFRRNHKTEER